MTPRTFGKYLLDREIARGGMARVHLARLRGLGGFEKRLVLKEIDPALASDPRFVQLFVEEANTLVQMSHPNIVPVYELGVVDGTYFLAMEHVRGATLDALVSEGPLDPAEVAHVGAQLAEALAYAHDRFSLVHRDVTPRNVMIDVHGHARLLDFGIAARLDGGGSGDAVFGTPGYLSPEQARAERLTAASDLFALGAVLHRAATGAHAFDASLDSTRDLRSPARLAALDALPDELARLLRSTLDPDPARRPASGKLVAAQLRAFLAAERPEGVADALGARADRLARRHEEQLEQKAEDSIATPPTSGRTQSLATSPVLDELLGTPPRPSRPRADETPGTARLTPAREPASEAPSPSTQRLDRASRPDSSAAEASAREGEARPRASLPAIVVLTLLLAAAAVWALSFARFEPPTTRAEPHALDPTPLEIDPPDAGGDAPEPGDAAAIDAFVDEPADAGAPTRSSEEAEDAHVASAPPRDASTRRAGDARAAVSSEMGSLTVSAVPWADVWIDGQSVGRTPVRDRELAAGPHRLELRCPPLGRELEHTVRIREGARARVSANLQVSPPTVVER
jgi:serine/threonine protein kinase